MTSLMAAEKCSTARRGHRDRSALATIRQQQADHWATVTLTDSEGRRHSVDALEKSGMGEGRVW